ncbi:MAG: hypothetical protein ACI4O7_09295 [Aristaeellaceae bacterium]
MSTNTRDQPAIATPEEVLVTITQIMRGAMTETATRRVAGGEEAIQLPPKVSERSRAAELLGKRYGLFAEKEAEAQPREEIARLIGEALAEMKAEKRGS